MTDPVAKFATPRVSAGALFVDDGQVLLVHKTYGNGWDIPGGYVDIGESPAAACRRELLEEIGLDRQSGENVPMHPKSHGPVEFQQFRVTDVEEALIRHENVVENDQLIRLFAPAC